MAMTNKQAKRIYKILKPEIKRIKGVRWNPFLVYYEIRNYELRISIERLSKKHAREEYVKALKMLHKIYGKKKNSKLDKGGRVLKKRINNLVDRSKKELKFIEDIKKGIYGYGVIEKAKNFAATDIQMYYVFDNNGEFQQLRCSEVAKLKYHDRPTNN